MDEVKEYEKIEGRLKEIEEKISSEKLDMDESLKLYEEAVDLGMKASQTIEKNVLGDKAEEDEGEEGEEAEAEADETDAGEEKAAEEEAQE